MGSPSLVRFPQSFSSGVSLTAPYRLSLPHAFLFYGSTLPITSPIRAGQSEHGDRNAVMVIGRPLLLWGDLSYAVPGLISIRLDWTQTKMKQACVNPLAR